MDINRDKERKWERERKNEREGGRERKRDGDGRRKIESNNVFWKSGLWYMPTV